MSFVVTSGKIFKEFKTLEEAKQYFQETDEFGLEIKEMDNFGNLRTLDKEEIGNVETQPSAKQPEDKEAKHPKEPAKPPEKKETAVKKDESIGYQLRSPLVWNIVKYGVLALLAIILIVAFLKVAIPIIRDFGGIYSKI